MSLLKALLRSEGNKYGNGCNATALTGFKSLVQGEQLYLAESCSAAGQRSGAALPTADAVSQPSARCASASLAPCPVVFHSAPLLAVPVLLLEGLQPAQEWLIFQPRAQQA